MIDPSPRAQVMEIVKRAIKKSCRWAALLLGGGVPIGVAILLIYSAKTPQFTHVDANPLIQIRIDDMRSGEVRFFAYRDNAGEQIRFLLARDSTGQTKAAFDACRRCYVYHKGYVSSDGNLVCRYCGNRYRLETMESGLASCVPVKLPIEIRGQAVTIKSADLEGERGLF